MSDAETRSDDIMTSKDVARALKCSVKVARRLMREMGALARRGLLRVRRQQFEEWYESQVEPPPGSGREYRNPDF